MGYDLSIVGGTVVTPTGCTQLNVHIKDGRVIALDAERPPAAEHVDAEGLLVLPGFVDAHVHLMDPGDNMREDFPSGTAAAAARGVTTVIEHTHSHPVRDAADLRAKVEYLAGRAHVDFALAAHVWADRLDALEALWREGVAFLKIFTCTTHGIPGLDHATLRAALREIARIGASCLVHCEDESLTADAERQLRAMAREDPAVISEWRSAEAELVAAQVVATLAEATKARTTIAHVSSPRVVRLVVEARRRGVDLAAETCPQYLLLRKDEILREGALRKFTPPARLRDAAEEAAMWALLRDGAFTYIASDHAPATKAQKLSGSIWDVHFGLPGLDTTGPLLIDAALSGRLRFETVARLYAEAPARRYGLFPRKGAIAVGGDADLVLIDPCRSWVISDAVVRSKAGWTPYAGRRVQGEAVATYLRGRQVAAEGEVAPVRVGRFLARGSRDGA
jgi:allantoinase